MSTPADDLLRSLTDCVGVEHQAAARVASLTKELEAAHDLLGQARTNSSKAHEAIRNRAVQNSTLTASGIAGKPIGRSDSAVGGMAIRVEMPGPDDAEVQDLVGSIVASVCGAIVKRLQLETEGAQGKKPTS